MTRAENLLASIPNDEDLRRAYHQDNQAFLRRQRARIQARTYMHACDGWMDVCLLGALYRRGAV